VAVAVIPSGRVVDQGVEGEEVVAELVRFMVEANVVVVRVGELEEVRPTAVAVVDVLSNIHLLSPVGLSAGKQPSVSRSKTG
jgi:hypothetical protein